MSTEKSMSTFEKINPSSSEKAPHIDSHNLQVGGGDWAAITGKYVKPVDDGFTIDFGGGKSTDGGGTARMLEAPAKGQHVRFDSPEYRAEHAQVGMENMGGAAKPGVPYGDGEDHNSQGYRDRARQVVADTEAQPRTTGSEYGDYLRSITPKTK